jgi:hypothetical protein
VEDWQDTDDDGDGIATSLEDTAPANGIYWDDFSQGGGIYPDYLYNPDYDGDGVNDTADLDSDNDGVLDANEDGGTGLDPSGDADVDGIQNFMDTSQPGFVDANADGIDDRYDADMDGIPDFHDLDSDNDGMQDILEAGGIDADDDGLVDGFTDVAPMDGLDDSIAGTPLTMPDSDGDGIIDVFDTDSDNDGIPDIRERGGSDADGDGRADVSTDSDHDGVADIFDVNSGGSPLTATDADSDGIENALDLDADGDGIVDILEAGGTDADGNGRVDGFADADNDGLDDSFDPDSGGSPLSDEDKDGDGLENRLDIDSDGDGIADDVEAQSISGYIGPSGSDGDGDGIDNSYDGDSGGSALSPVNTDGDGYADYLDDDSDNDGITDLREGNDADSDGTQDFSLAGTDTDGDGLDDAYDTDNGGTTAPVQDTEGDGKVDFRDNDDDDDGIFTIDEPLDFNPSNSVKDYLEDNVGACGVGFVTTSVSGNASNYNVSSTADTPGNALGSGDDAVAEFSSNNDFLILDLSDTVPASNTITIRGHVYSGSGPAEFSVESSLDGSTWADLQTSLSVTNSTFENIPYTFTAANGIRYLRITRTNNRKLGVDAVSYSFTLCDEDLDLDGIIDEDDEDDDNDGIPDISENGGVDPGADADGDGTPNYLDTDYPGFVDSNGDGTNDAFDFDGDGLPNSMDLDSDSDGITDAVEGNTGSLPVNMTAEGSYSAGYVMTNDADTDGLTNPRDLDQGGTALPLPDTDTDGSPDFLDIDADGDGALDLLEGFDDDLDMYSIVDLKARAALWETTNGNPGIYTTADTDLDGVPNWLEDADGDQVLNFLDPDLSGTFFSDSDADGLIDLYDPDIFGVAASVPDVDINGTPDYIDLGSIITLPVVWILFEGNQEGSFVELHWATASEYNADYFRLERATNGTEFMEIGSVRCAGNSETRQDYYFTDRRPSPGNNYYRIRQVDFDGAHEYSDIILVRCDQYINTEATIYPNPSASGELVRIGGIALPLEAGNVLLFDLKGQLLTTLRVEQGNRFRVPSLAAGMYIVKINRGSGLMSLRLVVR